MEKKLVAVLIILISSLDSCKEEFEDKGLVLINPTSKDIRDYSFALSDSIRLEIMYRGKEPIVYLSIRAFETVVIPENANGDGLPQYNLQNQFFWTTHYHIISNQPVTLSWPLPKNWRTKAKYSELAQISRTLLIRVVTENHILDYSYPLRAE
ncbi:MAG: hypothetical protein ACJA08_000548 [Cyclobacteriaceae bacterium]|jgi:hypothetical protein